MGRTQEEPGGNPYTGGGAPTTPESGGNEPLIAVRRPRAEPRSGPGQRFQAEERGPYPRTQQMPLSQFERYFEGQQAFIGRMSPGALMSLQRELGAVGLLAGDYANGAPDSSTKDAFASLLAISNEWGLSWRAALNRMMSQTSDTKARERGYQINPETGEYEAIEEKFVAPPLQLQLPNKLDVDRVIRQSSTDLLGQGWSQDQIDRVSNSFLGEVTRLQQETYNQEVDRMRREFEGQPGASETITDIEAPSAEAFAEEQIIQQNRQGVETNSGMELLLGLIDNWGGGL